MPHVDVNGFAMYFEVRGEGEPLLLLHGGTGIGADWRHVFPADPHGYQVVVPDLRGHGRSTNPSKTPKHFCAHSRPGFCASRTTPSGPWRRANARRIGSEIE